MREFTVRKGNFAGIHRIYDSEQECYDNEGLWPKKPWYDLKNEIGNWIVADDGFVCQILHKYELPNRRIIFRFPFISRSVYYRKRDDAWVAQTLYTYLTTSNKNSLVAPGYNRVLGASMNKNKKRWLSLVMSGLDPLVATKMSFPITRNVQYMTEKLFMDKAIIKQVNKELKSLKEQLDEEAALVGMTFEQMVVQKLMSALQANAKGVSDLIKQAGLGLKILDLIKENKVTDAKEASAEILPPPIP